MVKQSHVVFMKGKEAALKGLFQNTFKYLAIGYAEEDNGFEDSTDTSNTYGFNELDVLNNSLGYQRVELKNPVVESDPDTGKVIVKFTATVEATNIKESTMINQFAIVNNKEPSNETDVIFSATTFPKFNKTGNSSLTFIVGYKM